MTNENTAPSERVMFAAQMKIQYGERVVLSQCAPEWEAWQARAVLASKQVADTEAVRDALLLAYAALISCQSESHEQWFNSLKVDNAIAAIQAIQPAPQPDSKP